MLAAEEHPQIGEQRHQADLALHDVVVGAEREADVGPVVDRGARIGRIDVVTEQQVAEGDELGVATVSGGAALARQHAGQLEGSCRRRGRRRLDIGFEANEDRPGRNVHVRAHRDLAHSTGALGGDDRFELHALDHRHRVAGCDLVAGRDAHRHNDARHRRPDGAAVVGHEEVGRSIDLDVVVRSRGCRNDTELAPADDHSALEPAHAAEVDVGVGIAEANAVADGPGARHVEHVATSAMAELDALRLVDRRLGSPASTPGEEVGVGGHQLVVVAVDCGHQERQHCIGRPRRLILRVVDRCW